jgi:hypothetical protein
LASLTAGGRDATGAGGAKLATGNAMPVRGLAGHYGYCRQSVCAWGIRMRNPKWYSLFQIEAAD